MQAKLQALEEQQGDQPSASSAGVVAIAWRGTTSVVSAERVRVALGQALDLSKQVSMCLNDPLFRRCPINCLDEWCIAQEAARASMSGCMLKTTGVNSCLCICCQFPVIIADSRGPCLQYLIDM